MNIFKEMCCVDNDVICDFYLIVDKCTLGKKYIEIKSGIDNFNCCDLSYNKVVYRIDKTDLQTENIVKELRFILGIPNKMIFRILKISSLSSKIDDSKLIKILYFFQLFSISGVNKNIGSIMFLNLEVKEKYELFSLFDVLCDNIINLDIINFALQSVLIAQINFEYQSDKCREKTENEITLFDLTRHT